MTQVSEIILAAFRESVQDPLQHPNPTEYAQAMQRLKSIVASTYGAEIGEMLRDWPLGTAGAIDPDEDWTSERWRYPLANARAVVQITSSDTIYLPEDPDDGARFSVVDPNAILGTCTLTVNGNGRRIGSDVATAAATYAMNTARIGVDLLYRADLGIWVIVSPLADTAEMPFPEEFDDYFILMLAMRINPRYGRTINDAQALFLDRAQGQLRARYRQYRTVGVDPGLRSRAGIYGGSESGGSVPRGRKGWMF
jgi:hypothetical protein